MDAYVINMQCSIDRRKHMEKILSRIENINYEFVEAVDGSLLTAEEVSELFDVKKFEHHYNRSVCAGEIGCTLSHQKCYQKMLDENLESILILEDDIEPYHDFEKIIEKLINWINVPQARIILLTSLFYYLPQKKIKLDNEHQLINVYYANRSSAYLVNRAAAKKLLCKKPFFVADDWAYFKNEIEFKAVKPHVVEPDGMTTSTMVSREYNFFRHRIFKMVAIHGKGLVLRVLRWLHLYEVSRK